MKVFDTGRVHSGFRDDISDQAFFTAGVFFSDDDILLYRRMLSQYLFNFPQFNTKATDLYLTIHSTEKLDIAIGAIARNIARSIQRGSRPLTERVCHEPFGG